MGIISKSIFEDILSLVLENRFRDRATDPQHESRGRLRHLNRLAMENPSYSSAFQIFAECRRQNLLHLFVFGV